MTKQLLASLLAAALSACSQLSFAQTAGTAAPSEVAQDASATSGTLDPFKDLVKSIALYPDVLIAQILPASTYPMDIVQAYRWVEANPDKAKDEKAVSAQTWDASVKALVPFPDVLKKMNDDLDWTNNLGQAFLQAPDQVLAAVQDLRGVAKDAGALKDSPQQKVVVAEDSNIEIQPADPQIVYVPQYDPNAVYASQYVPQQNTSVVYSDPAYYNSGYVGGSNLLSYGVGVATGAALYNNIDWNDGYVNDWNDWDADWDNWGGGNNVHIGDTNINIDGERNNFFNNIDSDKTLNNAQKSKMKDSFNKLPKDKQAGVLNNYSKMDENARRDAFKNTPAKGGENRPGAKPGASGGAQPWKRDQTKPAPKATASSPLNNYRGQGATAGAGAVAAARPGGAGAAGAARPAGNAPAQGAPARLSSNDIQNKLASPPGSAGARPSGGQVGGLAGGQGAARPSTGAAGAANQMPARPSTSQASRPASSNAGGGLSGYGSAAQTRQDSNRGQASRQASSPQPRAAAPAQSRPAAQPQRSASNASRPAPSAQSRQAPSRPQQAPSGGGGGRGGGGRGR